jgi:hypothetical protein
VALKFHETDGEKKLKSGVITLSKTVNNSVQIVATKVIAQRFFIRLPTVPQNNANSG